MSRLSLFAAAAALAPIALVPAVAVAQGAAAPAAPAAASSPAYVPAPAPTLPRTRAARPTRAAITADDLMSRLYPFADDSMQGREAGTVGNVKGTDYIAAELQRLGLVPAGENGTYFQTIPLRSRRLSAASAVTAGGASLAGGTDFAVLADVSAQATAAPIVWGGMLGAPDALPDSVARGKVVVLRAAVPALQRVAMTGVAPYPGAVAVMIVGFDPFIPTIARGREFLDKGTRPATAQTPVLLASTAKSLALFGRPVDSLTVGFTAPATAAVTIASELVPPAAAPRNVVAILPGSDPALKGQYVAIGAHNDHVGFDRAPVDHDSLRLFNHLVRPGGAEDGQKRATPEQQAQVNAALAAWRAAHPGTQRADSIFNGADDDGSGSMTTLEVAEQLAALKGAARPKRSILFVWHVAEEKGLFGSEWFTDHPTVPRDSIVAQLNMDMVGRGGATDVTGLDKAGAVLRGGPNYLQLVGSRRLSTELGDLVEQVNAQKKHGFTFDYALDANGHPMNIYCRSDHYEYARYGIPVTFFTTGGHADYHQVTDEAQYIDYPHMARVGRLVSDVTLALANRAARPTVDQPKPDPAGRCQQ